MFWCSVTSRLWMWRDAIFSLLKMSTWDCLFGSRLKLFYHWKDCLWIFVKSPSCSFVNFCLSLRVRNKDASPANRWALLFAIQEGEENPHYSPASFFRVTFTFNFFATQVIGPHLVPTLNYWTWNKANPTKNVLLVKTL